MKTFKFIFNLIVWLICFVSHNILRAVALNVEDEDPAPPVDPAPAADPAPTKAADTLPAVPDFKYDPNGDPVKQLKELLPYIINFKSILGDAVKNESAVRDLKSQLKNLEGNITNLSSKVIKLGNKNITIRPTGWSNEKKEDFATMFKNIAKRGNPDYIDNAKYNAEILKIQDKYKDDKAALNTGTDSQGGYLIPSAFTDEVQRVAEDNSLILQKGRKVPMTIGNELPILSLLTGTTIAWVAEAGAVPQVEPTFAENRIKAQKLASYSLMSNEFLEDEVVGITDLLVTLFGEDMGAEIDNQAFQGTGAGVASQEPFTGILNTVGVNAETMTGTGFSSITFDNLTNAIALLKRSSLNGAQFVMHRTIENVLKKLKDSNGQYIWSPAAVGSPATMWGYPYDVNDQMPALTDTAAATGFIIFGNLKNFQYGVKAEMSVRVATELKMLNDQTILMVRKRMAMGTALPAAFSIIKTAAGS